MGMFLLNDIFNVRKLMDNFTFFGGGKGGGGGGGSAPTQTTAYQTNLPEYARPYVETMLGATQRQLFNTSTGPDGTTIDSFKPYQPYSTNPNDYVAGFSPLQQQAQSGAANMQLPQEYAQAAGLTGMNTMGSMGLAGQEAQAGNRYNQMATNPYAVGAFMNPYIQQSLDPQLAMIQHDADTQQMQAQGNATRAGAFGGTRSALMAAEAQRAGELAKQQAIGQGYNNAYNQAQQAMQYGAGLGLQGQQAAMQGYGQGLQGAGQLANIGSQALQGQQGIYNLQNQLGGQQQALEQQKINQAIQDYATQQQYPMMQLGLMSNMLRGLPMQSTTVQSYQAQPSTFQQILGLGGTAAALGKAGIFRKGGKVKGYLSGGVIEGLRAKAEQMLDADPTGGELKKLAAQSKSEQEKKVIGEVLSGIAVAPTGNLGTNMAGGGIIAFANGGKTPRYSGAYDEFGSLIGAGDDDTASTEPPKDSWGSSILGELTRQKREAWDNNVIGSLEKMLKDGQITKEQYDIAKQKNADVAAQVAAAKANKQKSTVGPAEAEDASFAGNGLGAAMNYAGAGGAGAGAGGAGAGGAGAGAGGAGAGGAGTGMGGLKGVLAEHNALLGFDPNKLGEKGAALMKYLEDKSAKQGEQNDSDRALRAAAMFAKFGSTAGPMGKVAAETLGEFATGEAAARKEQEKLALENTRMQADIEAGQRALQQGNLKQAEEFFGKAEDRKMHIQVAQIQASAHGIPSKAEAEQIEKVMKDKNIGYSDALQFVKGASHAEPAAVQAGKASLAHIQNRLMILNGDPKKNADEIAQLKTLESSILDKLNKSGAGPAPVATGDIPAYSPEVYAKLQPGQQYRDPQGQIRVKG